MSEWNTSVHIRWMIRSDMPQVLEIERQDGLKDGLKWCWTEEDFLRVLRQKNVIGMVAELGEMVAGFMIYDLGKTRLRIMNFAVHREFIRTGIGSQMMAKLIEKLSNHRRTKISMGLHERDLVGQLFLKSQGFRAVRIVRNDHTDEDVYMMEYSLVRERVNSEKSDNARSCDSA